MKKTVLIITLLLIIFLIILRFINLDNDPPLFFADYGQSQLTDPYYYTQFARNKVLFDDWDPFENEVWNVIKFSLISGFSFIVFKLGGISRISANISGLLLHIGGLLLFVLGLIRCRPKKEVLITILLLVANALLFIYSRIPYLENGLIFISGLVFYLFVRFSDYRIMFVVGFLIGLAVLHTKLFGIVLLLPVLVCVWIQHAYKLTKISNVVGGLLVSGIYYIALFYRWDFSSLLAYNKEIQKLYTSVPALATSQDLLERFVSYGANSGLLEFGLPFITLTGLGLIVFLMREETSLSQEKNLPIRFSIIWLVIGFLVLMLFEYRPLRYFLFCLLPMAAISSWFILSSLKGTVVLKAGYTGLIGLPFVLLNLSWQYMMRFSPVAPNIGILLIVTSLTVILITVAVYLLLRSRTIRVPRMITIPIVLSLVTWYAASNLNDMRRTLFESGRVLIDFNRELPELIGSNNLVSGAYGPALTIENNLKGVYNYFGATQTTGTFLETYPVTHVLATSTDFESMKDQSPQLADVRPIGRFFVRNYTIMLYCLADEQIPGYQLSTYEEAYTLLHANQPDSVLAILERYEHVNECFQNIFSLRVRALFNAGNVDNAIDVTKEFADRYPDNYAVQLTAADLFGEMYTINNDRELLRLTDKFLKQARALNPHIKTLVSDLVNSAIN